MTSPNAFFIFSKFWFSGEGEKKGKNDPNDKKTSLSVSQELCLIWLWFLVHMCKISGNFFFHFFKILVFRIFQNSTLSVKKKLRSVSHLHMCVIFFVHLECIHMPMSMLLVQLQISATWQYVTLFAGLVTYLDLAHWSLLNSLVISTHPPEKKITIIVIHEIW